MKKKRLLLFTLLLVLISIGVHAQEFNYTANGREWKCKLNTDGTAAIIGVTEAASTCSGVLNIPDAVIDYGGVHHNVTTIQGYAFKNYKLITEVNIPASVKTIKEEAFENCEGLISIGMPGVESIGEYAFVGCKSLTNVNMAPKTIGKYAFSACEHLSSVDLTSVEHLGSSAFWRSGLTSVTFGHNLAEIPDQAFESTPLTTVSIPAEVTSIGERAFRFCQNLASVHLTEGLTTIGGEAFGDCSVLASFTIPSTVTSIGESVFWSSTSIPNPTLDYTNLHYPPSLLKQIIEKGSFRRMDWVGTTFEIPSDVTKIGREAFHGCTSWTKADLTLENLPVGAWAFAGCAGLTGTLTIKDCTFGIVNQESDAFKGTNFSHLVLGTSGNILDMRPLADLFDLESYYPTYEQFAMHVPSLSQHYMDLTILDGPTEIIGRSNSPFITQVNFPSTVKKISGFDHYSALTNVVLPEGLTTIDREAFWCCVSLETITPFPSTLTTIGWNAFLDCNKLQGDVSGFLPASLKRIDGGAFANNKGITGEAVFPPLDPVADDADMGTAGNPFLNTSVYGIRMGAWEKYFAPNQSNNVRAGWQNYSGLLYIDARDCTVRLANSKGEPNLANKFTRYVHGSRQDEYRNFAEASVNTLIYLPSEAKFNDPALPTATFDQRFETDPYDDEYGDAANFIMDGKCKQFLVKDRLPYRVPIAFTALEAKYNREFNVTDGKAVSTLYLPYPTDLPTGMQAYTLVKKGFDEHGDKAFIFREVPLGTRLEANKPYIVRITDGQTHKLPVMHNVEVPVSPKVTGTDSGQIGIEDTDWKFYGTTERIENAEASAQKAFYLNGNKWWQVQDGVENDYIAPFRCFVSSPTGVAPAKSFVMVFEGEEDNTVTGIKQLESGTESDIKSGKYPFYSVDGKLMGKDYDKLESGQIYIVNGKKFYKF